jgi:RNA polymerase sigma factor (sigma-70 family)
VTPKSLIEPARHAGTALLRSQSDARLVDLTREGNERAFEAIVQRYRRALLRYCSRLLPLARAEDAVQQAFLSAHRAIHAGDVELNLRPWLYRIAHNASLNLLRQQGFDHDQLSEEIDGVETPPQAFERGERLREVVAAVRDLPERQRSAIVLQALEGRSYDEIALELGVSDGAVRQLLNRARNSLRDAAAAITPAGLLTRLAASGASDGSVAERVAKAVAGAGSSALLAKAGATLVVAGAVTAAAVTGELPGSGDHQGRDSQQAGAGAGSAVAPAAAGARREDLALSGGRAHGSPVHAQVRRRSAVGTGSHRGSGRQGTRSNGDGAGRHNGGFEPSDGRGSGGHGEDGSRGSLGSNDHSGSGDRSSSGHGSDDGGSSGPSTGSGDDGFGGGSFTSGSSSGDAGSSSSGSSGSGSGDALAPSDDGIDSSGRDRSGSTTEDPPEDPISR